MASTRRQREIALARAQRQAARRAERRRRQRQRLLVVAAAVTTLLVIGVVAFVASRSGGKRSPAAAAKPSPSTPASSAPTPQPVASRPVACGTAVPKAQAKQTFKAEPPLTVTGGTYEMAVTTSCGPIRVALDATKAPHTVNSLAFLAGKRFYDGTLCHRAVNTGGLFVLQCGDPTGTGSGGPGYTLPEENLKGATYPRGTFAMAKSSAAHSTGSQFFLVDKDSQLPAQYTVAGQITAGLDVLDKLLAVGNDGANNAGDGAPLKRIYLDTVTVRRS